MDTDPELQFNYRRHFSELMREVLPIFMLVAVIGFIVMLYFLPDRPLVEVGVSSRDYESTIPRVSLLEAADSRERKALGVEAVSPFDSAFVLARPIDLVMTPRVTRFDAPMGSEHAALTYNAQPFLVSRHLGDDVNGIGGQDSDLGDPVYAVADGRVCMAGWASEGWGNVVALLHRSPENGEVIQSFYAHLESMRVPVDAEVRRGQILGTVGKGDGRYLAHLHFEMRDYVALAAGAGYADQAQGRFSGEEFLRRFRGVADDLLNVPPIGIAPVLPDDSATLKMNFDDDEEATEETAGEKSGKGSGNDDGDADGDRPAVARPPGDQPERKAEPQAVRRSE